MTVQLSAKSMFLRTKPLKLITIDPNVIRTMANKGLFSNPKFL